MDDRIYWNSRTYGSAIKVNTKLVLSVVCLLTPCTNWLIPFVIMKAKAFYFRY